MIFIVWDIIIGYLVVVWLREGYAILFVVLNRVVCYCVICWFPKSNAVAVVRVCNVITDLVIVWRIYRYTMIFNIVWDIIIGNPVVVWPLEIDAIVSILLSRVVWYYVIGRFPECNAVVVVRVCNVITDLVIVWRTYRYTMIFNIVWDIIIGYPVIVWPLEIDAIVSILLNRVVWYYVIGWTPECNAVVVVRVCNVITDLVIVWWNYQYTTIFNIV